jgi:hypothetical protein
MLNDLLDGLQVIGLAVLGGAIVASNFGSLIIVRCHVRLRPPVQPPHCPDSAGLVFVWLVSGDNLQRSTFPSEGEPMRP